MTGNNLSSIVGEFRCGELSELSGVFLSGGRSTSIHTNGGPECRQPWCEGGCLRFWDIEIPM